jgi:hypothetical protein
MSDRWFYAGECSLFAWKDLMGQLWFCLRTGTGSDGLDLRPAGVVVLLDMLKECAAHMEACGCPVTEHSRNGIAVLDQAVREYGLTAA